MIESVDSTTHAPHGMGAAGGIAGTAHGRTHERVLFLVSGYPSASRPSLGIFHRTLAEAVRCHGLRVDIGMPVPFVPPGFEKLSSKWKQYANIPYRYSENGIDVYAPRYFHVPSGDILSFPHYFIKEAMLSEMGRHPDVIHAHFAYPTGLAAIGLGKAWGVPVLLTLHGSDVHTNPYVNGEALNRFRRAVLGATHVTAVSTALAEETEALCGRRPEVVPIGIGLDAYAHLPAKRTAREMLGLPAHDTLVLFIGALVPEKGVKEFLHAFDGSLERIGEGGLRGVVVGAGPLESEAVGHRGVVCLGSRPNDAVPLLMRACDMIVLPSYAEGMPTVLVEAGAAGLPIIASCAGGIPELLADGRGELLEAVSADAIRSAIRRVVVDRERAARRSEAMKEYIGAQYDARRNAAVFAERYRECIAAMKRQ